MTQLSGLRYQKSTCSVTAVNGLYLEITGVSRRIPRPNIKAIAERFPRPLGFSFSIRIRELSSFIPEPFNPIGNMEAALCLAK